MADLASELGLDVIEGRDAGGNPLLEEGEAVLHTFGSMQLILAADSDQGPGKLFVTEGRIIWLSSRDPSLGFAAHFPAITMHAIATDPETVQRPCMYLQLDRDEDAAQMDEEEDDEPPLPELRLVPDDAAALDSLFAALCAGAERNPDTDADEGQGSLFFDQGEVLAGAAEAYLGLEDVEELVGGDPDRFADPGEESDEEEYDGGEGEPDEGRQNGGTH